MKIKIHNSVCDSIDFYGRGDEYFLNESIRADKGDMDSEVEYMCFNKWRNLSVNWDLSTNMKKINYRDFYTNEHNFLGSFV